MIALLQNIRSIHNVGSMFRTADAAGVAHMVLAGYTPAPVDAYGRPDQRFTKVSLGAEKTVSWERVASGIAKVKKLKRDGWMIVMIEQSPKATNLWHVQFAPTTRERLMMVVGNERQGLSSAMLSQADYILEIPMAGTKESLNVSVAFGIASFAIGRSSRAT